MMYAVNPRIAACALYYSNLPLITHLAYFNDASYAVLRRVFRTPQRRQDFIDTYVLINDFELIRSASDYLLILMSAVMRAKVSGEIYADRLANKLFEYLDALSDLDIEH